MKHELDSYNRYRGNMSAVNILRLKRQWLTLTHETISKQQQQQQHIYTASRMMMIMMSMTKQRIVLQRKKERGQEKTREYLTLHTVTSSVLLVNLLFLLLSFTPHCIFSHTSNQRRKKLNWILCFDAFLAYSYSYYIYDACEHAVVICFLCLFFHTIILIVKNACKQTPEWNWNFDVREAENIND